MVRALSFDAVVKTVALAEVTSPPTLRQVARRYTTTGELTPPKSIRLTLDKPQHMLFGATGPPLNVHAVIHEYIREAAEENVYISLLTIRTRAYTTLDVLILRSTLHNWLRKMCLVYGEKKLTGLKTSYARALIRKYILEYSRVRQEGKRGNVVLVWMDKSYIHTGYCSRFSWHAPADEKASSRIVCEAPRRESGCHHPRDDARWYAGEDLVRRGPER